MIAEKFPWVDLPGQEINLQYTNIYIIKILLKTRKLFVEEGEKRRMLGMRKKSVLAYFAGLVILMTVLVWAGVALASDELSTVQRDWAAVFEQKMDVAGIAPIVTSLYAKDVEHLKNLHLLPTKTIEWTQPAIWSDFMTILWNLNNRKANTVPVLDNYLSVANCIVTYAQAIEVLLPVVGYPVKGDLANINLAKSLGISVEKTSIYDALTGEEMAHLIYRTLKTKPAKNNGKTVLEDVFQIQNVELVPRKVVKLTATQIEVEYEGTFTLANNVTVYDANTGDPLSMDDVLVGMTGSYLVLDSNNRVVSIGIMSKFTPSRVRVILSSSLNSTGGSNGYDFTDVRVSANRTVYVRTKTPTGLTNLATVASGTTMTFTRSGSNVVYNGVSASRMYLESDYTDVQYTLLSTTRSGGTNPVYDSSMEIAPSDTLSKLYAINDLPMEKYLYKVVPSEMPASWHVEALKCQAVAARSYAVGEINGGGYASRGANVDDSTACQVYNNSATNATVMSAVDATKGQVMTYNGEVITAYFFSTSAGRTANNEEVWHNSSTGAFPGSALPYTRAKAQILNYTYPVWTDAAATLAYYKNTAFSSSNAFDYSASWFRWNVNLTRAELEKTISKNLPLRESADQSSGFNFIQTVSGTAPTPGSTTFSIGTLLDLRVIQRGGGGNIMTLEIVGTNGTWRVLKEYNVRTVLKPTKTDTSSTRDIIIYCHNGVTSTNYALLPSAFCAFEIHKSGTSITDVTIYGGGNGHGVGMSQYGAKGYAEAGYTYQNILNNFYTGVAYTTLY